MLCGFLGSFHSNANCRTVPCSCTHSSICDSLRRPQRNLIPSGITDPSVAKLILILQIPHPLYKRQLSSTCLSFLQTRENIITEALQILILTALLCFQIIGRHTSGDKVTFSNLQDHGLLIFPLGGEGRRRRCHPSSDGGIRSSSSTSKH